MAFLISAVLLAGCGRVESLPDAARIIDSRGGDTIDAPPSGVPRLAIDRNSLNLGSVIIGQTSSPGTFTISNEGNAPTSFVSATLTGAGFRITENSCVSITLEPEATCQVSVVFNPTTSEPVGGMLTVQADQGGSVTAGVSGTGVAPGALSLTPSTAMFGTVVEGASATHIFMLTNTGGAATTAISLSRSGTDAALFAIENDGCSGRTLGGGANCTFTVRLSPGAGAPSSPVAQVVASATVGGNAVSSLQATVISQANLDVSGSGNFADVVIGTPETATLVVRNLGGQTAGPLAISFTGPNAAEFSHLTGMAGDCTTATTLAGNGAATCNLRVRANPTANGIRSATLVVSASPGGTEMVPVSMNAQAPASLSAPSPVAFGDVEVNVLSGTLTWRISNFGDVASAVPVLSTSGSQIQIGSGTCNASIPAGGFCDATVTVRVTAPGVLAGGSVQASIPGSVANASVTAFGKYRLTVTRSGSGGSISSNPSGIACPNNCEELYTAGTSVTLTATTTNGTGVYFSGWSGTGTSCDGSPNRNCVFSMNSSRTATGTFLPITHNLIFASSTTHAMTLGSVTAYDNACNSAATAAGINNTAGNNFVAWISNGNSPAPGRLMGASGWVRMDGRVFATSIANLLTNQAILNPVRYNELGADVVANTFLATGTNSDGTSSSQTCADWTSTSGSFLAGVPYGGPASWGAGAGVGGCGSNWRLLCMMKQFSIGPTTPTFTGKKVWRTNSIHAISSTNPPDNACHNSRPVGVSLGRALLATTTTPASSLLSPTQMYVRPDGQEVGTGGEFAAVLLRGGIWQSGNGTYVSPNARSWTGSASPTAPGTAASTCNDWTDPGAGSGAVGLYDRARSELWSFSNTACNTTSGSTAAHLYCYEP